MTNRHFVNKHLTLTHQRTSKSAFTHAIGMSLFRYIALFICHSFKQAIFSRYFETVPDVLRFRYVAQSFYTKPFIACGLILLF